MPLHRKQTRLPASYYIGCRSHFVTICCDLRHPYLADPQISHRVLGQLLACAARHSFLLHAYCLMPDHLHALAQGTQPSSDLREFIRNFKLRSAHDFRQTTDRRLWEMSYYDHILRSAESAEHVACYIWSNPVRKQLCRSPWDFPFSGSQTVPWPLAAPPSSSWTPPWK